MSASVQDGRIPFGRCGMPCGLCAMYHTQGDSRCVGCCDSEDSFASQCKMFRCCGGKGHVSCGQCAEYPCAQVDAMEEFKGLDTGKVWLRVCGDIRESGVEAWYPAYEAKCLLLREALDRYNDGRMKSYLCRLFIAQALPVLQAIMQEALPSIPMEADAKERGKRFKQIVKAHT